MSKIFINLPTMNDFEYLSTVERIYDFAKNPDDISIGTTIFWKSKDIKKNSKPFFIHIKNSLDKNFKKVKYDIQPWILYPGIAQGRLSPNKHFNNEKYFLSIDSHTEFIDNWDESVIDLYQMSRDSFGKRRVITAYLTPYCIDNDLYNKEFWNLKSTNKNVTNLKSLIYQKDVSNRWQIFDFYKQPVTDTFKIQNLSYPMPNDKIIGEEEYKILKKYLIDQEFLPAKKISAHYYFTESDPWLTKYNLNLHKDIHWWLEEFYQSSLAYARGYNLVWHKTQIFFHKYSDLKYKTNYRFYENFYKDEYSSIDDKKNIHNLYIKNSINNINDENRFAPLPDNEIINNLFNRVDLDDYFPRSISGFLKYSGIDLINRRTSPWWEVPDLNVVYK